MVTVTAIDTEGDAYNVIPETVRLRGTVRALKTSIRDLAVEALHRIVECTAKTYGAAAVVDYEYGYPPTVNACQETKFAGEVAATVVGKDKVNTQAPPLLAGEDFSYMLNARPGAFIFVGNGDSASLHHPTYDFSDSALPVGCTYWVNLVEKALPLV